MKKVEILRSNIYLRWKIFFLLWNYSIPRMFAFHAIYVLMSLHLKVEIFFGFWRSKLTLVDELILKINEKK